MKGILAKINYPQIIIFQLLIISRATSHNIVKSLPGFPGNLPFYLETGYVGVGEEEEVQLFYYFVKSERDVANDPLMLWLTGGPGCSGFSGLVFEIADPMAEGQQNVVRLCLNLHLELFNVCRSSCVGPLNLNTSACNWHSKYPTYQINPYSWTKVASIIFLDAPAGTGFSYATNQKGYYSDDIKTSRYNYQFLIKWLVDHAEFQNNPQYISGDSYSGKIIPLVVQEITDGIRAGFQYIMNFKGYILGNPLTREEDSYEGRYKYAHRVSLLSDELYQSMKISCNGSYEDANLENVSCRNYLQAVTNNLDPLSVSHILEPKCSSDETLCRDSMYRLLNYWANDIQVQEALHVREDTKPYWIRCNTTLSYELNKRSLVGYHQNHTQGFMHVLIYSGDQDIRISYVGTLDWIRMLNISITEEWKPWFVYNQVGGYTTKYSNGHYHLTFLTVKGAGHTAPEYKRSECLNMIMNWFADVPF